MAGRPELNGSGRYVIKKSLPACLPGWRSDMVWNEDGRLSARLDGWPDVELVGGRFLQCCRDRVLWLGTDKRSYCWNYSSILLLHSSTTQLHCVLDTSVVFVVNLRDVFWWTGEVKWSNLFYNQFQRTHWCKMPISANWPMGQEWTSWFVFVEPSLKNSIFQSWGFMEAAAAMDWNQMTLAKI